MMSNQQGNTPPPVSNLLGRLKMWVPRMQTEESA